MTLSNYLMPVLTIRYNKTGIFLLLQILVAVLFLSAVSSTADVAIASGEIIGNENGRLFIRVRNASVKTVVAGLQKDFAVDIRGLESLENKRISFAFEADSLEKLVKALLRHLNIKNYAFEFADSKLKSVMVVPGSKHIDTDVVDSDSDSAKPEKTVTVAVIKSIVESSQAEALDLMPGDFIVEYDGIRIYSAARLVTEVKKKSAKNQIEMIVVRNKTSRRLILQGGVIGVRVTTEKVPRLGYLN